jgi:DNA end-binding protein Ku
MSVPVAPRPYWKGYLKLSLVSCPIALSPATSSSEKVSFRQVNKATGNRIRYKKVDSETGEEVTNDEIGKGYEAGKNEFIIMDDDELEAVELESTHTIEIDQFVPFAQIDKRYYDQPYYIVPNDEVGVEAFSVIREAMVGKGVVRSRAW